MMPVLVYWLIKAHKIFVIAKTFEVIINTTGNTNFEKMRVFCGCVHATVNSTDTLA